MTPMNRRWRIVVGLLASVAMLSLAACGDDADDPTAVSGEDGGAAAETAGDGNGDAGDGDSDGALVTEGTGAGDDFPIPLPEGVVLDALADAGLSFESQRQLYYPSDDYGRVVAFYDEWTSANGEWARGEAAGTVSVQRIDGDGMQSIAITPDQDPGAQAEGPLTFVLLVAG